MRSPLDLRGALAAVALAATLFVAGRTLLSEELVERPLPPVAFPAVPSLPGWQAITEEPDPAFPHTRRYRRSVGERTVSLETQFIPDLPTHYIRNPKIEARFMPRGHLPLDAGMQYYVSGRATVVANGQHGRPSDARVEAGPAGTGYWKMDGRIHLSTLITSAGECSIQPRTLAHAMYLHHLSLGKIAGWLFARESFPDRRCVLIHLSVVDDGGDESEARALLQTAWGEWRAVHSPVFPPG